MKRQLLKYQLTPSVHMYKCTEFSKYSYEWLALYFIWALINAQISGVARGLLIWRLFCCHCHCNNRVSCYLHTWWPFCHCGLPERVDEVLFACFLCLVHSLLGPRGWILFEVLLETLCVMRRHPSVDFALDKSKNEALGQQNLPCFGT